MRLGRWNGIEAHKRSICGEVPTPDCGRPPQATASRPGLPQSRTHRKRACKRGLDRDPAGPAGAASSWRSTLHPDHWCRIRPGRPAQPSLMAGVARHRLLPAHHTRPRAGTRRMRQRRLKDQLAGVMDAYPTEARPRIQAEGASVVRSDQEANAPATGQPAERGHDARHSRAAEAMALAATLEREPAQPPACAVAPIRVGHIEADHPALRPYRDQRVS